MNTTFTAYVRYCYFHQEQHGACQKKNHPFTVEQLYWNPADDFYVRPMGQQMNNAGSSIEENANVFEQIIILCQTQHCHGCPLRSAYHKV